MSMCEDCVYYSACDYEDANDGDDCDYFRNTNICNYCVHKDETCYVFEFPCLDYEPREEDEKE